jgi:hypothetical protein
MYFSDRTIAFTLRDIKEEMAASDPHDPHYYELMEALAAWQELGRRRGLFDAPVLEKAVDLEAELERQLEH